MHDHAHDHDHDPARSRASTRRLAIVLALTAGYTLAEVVGGFWTGSLALLADAGHMATDNVALALALFAARLAERRPDPARTYGFQRAEILAALANGAALMVLCGFLAWESLERLAEPLPVKGGAMAVIAAGGLVVNLAGAALLRRHQHGMNVRAAFLHVVGDLLGSVGALLAALLIAAFGWTWADPAASLAIVAILGVGSWRLVSQAVHVLMEGTPANVDAEAVRACLAQTPGVAEVHDLHLWCLREGIPILTAHLVLDHSVAAPAVLRDATERVHARFGIDHVTLQIEPPDYNIRHGFDRALDPTAGSR
ncbi:MAG TPA: cation diffusion facilitator family transporter [Candidatus Polarisedimenticolaceae bacterium]